MSKKNYKLDGQIDIFGDTRQKYRYSIYAVPYHYDGGHVETVISAYSEKQACAIFSSLYPDYRIVDMYKV